MSEHKLYKNFSGSLKHATYPITSDECVKTVVGWHYEVPDRHVLPDCGMCEDDYALVDDELIYQCRDRKWVFDLEQTKVFHQYRNHPHVVKTSIKADPVAGIEFSSKPRDEWSMGNWIAHVGGGIRSDHCVVFGSVMAVDAMIKQIINTIKKSDHLKREAGPLTVKLTGGTQYQRFVVAMDIAGGLNSMNVTSGPGLAETIALENGKGGLTFEKAAVVMAAIEVSGGITVDIEVSPKDQDNG